MAHNAHKAIENLNILNWNSNGITNQRSLFIAFLARYNIDIACISETHLSTTDNFKIPGYCVYRNDRQAAVASGGVAIIIKRKFSHFNNTITTNKLETVEIKVKLNDQSYLRIVSAYRQPNKRLDGHDVKTIFDTSDQTLVIGDFNCKNILWGCRANNPAGIKLEQLSTMHAFQVISPPEPTYFPYRQDHQPDILDLILQKNFAHPITQRVITELNSDHLPVIISFLCTPEPKAGNPNLYTGPIDWHLFQTVLDNTSLPDPALLETRELVNTAILHFTEAISATAKSSARSVIRRSPTNYNLPPNYIITLITQRSRIRREWQRTRTQESKRLLNKITHRIKKELDEFRVRAYQKFIENIGPNDPGMWRTTRKILKTPEELPTLSSEGKTYCSDEEKSTAFAHHLETVFRPNITCTGTHIMHVINTIDRNYPTDTNNIDPVSSLELKAIVSTFSKRKSPGYDLITNKMLQNLTEKSFSILASIFNACLRLGYFPDAWKHAVIVMFSKPGKDKKDPRNYRPISLLTTLSKLLEKVIHSRLAENINAANILPPYQFGFRSGYSTSHQLQRITEIISTGFENKLYTTTLFLDVAQAFDRVWIEGLKLKLTRLDIPDYLKAIIFSFLENRTFAVKVNSATSNTRDIHAGVPQGSILGPLLFNIYTSDMPHVEAILATYADDTAIATQSPDLATAISKLQHSTNTLHAWFTKWNIQINASKCQAKIFTLRRIQSPGPICFNGTPIPWIAKDAAVRYLGLYLDTRLTWSLHINVKLNQCHARLKQLYPLINRKSSLKAECTVILYKALLRPLALYASSVWCNTSVTNLRKLQKFQNKVLRIAVNAPWFVRNQQIHYELGVSPIREFIIAGAKRTINNATSCAGAVHYKLYKQNIHQRLKRNMPQDLVF